MRFSLLPLLGPLALTLVPPAVAAEPPDVPLANSTEVRQHFLAREAMITLEKRQRQDHIFRQKLSPVAQHADALVRAIRQDEIDHYWRHAGTPQSPEEERFAGEVFPKARPFISSTKLWKIVKRMPKGSLLHAHLSAMLPYETVIRTIIHTEGMVVSASHDVATEERKQNATIAFAHVNTTVQTDTPSIHSTDYVPNTQIPVKRAADSYPGGQDAFVKFVTSKMTVSPEDSVRHELGVDEIWRKFQGYFDPAGTMLTYEPVVRTFYRKLFERLAEDGVRWVEIRAGGSSGKLVHNGNEDPDPDLDVWWEVLEDELGKFKKSEKGSKFWGVRVIWSDWRGKQGASLTRSMSIALERKQRFPELFSGYDLVAQEDLGHSLIELAPELIWFQEQTEKLNVTVPFFFHAGETLGDGNSTDLNLFDAVLFNSRRIGHGFSLYKHPKLMNDVVENAIMVEVCPISNEVLRLATDILHHPLPAMIANGVPTAISNDDPAILGQDAAGISYDFYETIQAFDNLGLAGLGALAQNSLRWSNFEDQDDATWVQDIDLAEHGKGIKGERIRDWNKEWEEFCQWVVDEYSSQYAVADV
ncbi:hypothetical protein BDV59DRAFT_206905 [Aspergillus ambiguus]|uniref:adenosine deaminase family protein n=1 Tax=Aspergillus ambiguus TaxID=176160 RepID=UPI003CCD948F